ncbi:MAG: hypothetical protein IPN68_14605, partial [Bacteroidetes bacterium]|nr:hypothetical protein [Bacteroidota bacterium]
MVQLTDALGNAMPNSWTVNPTDGSFVTSYSTPSGFFEGPVVQYTWNPVSKLLITPLAQTYPISHTGNIGTDLANNVFEVTLRNWGPCNLWLGDYFSSDPPVTEFSRLRLVDGPLAPTISNVTICGSASQTLTVTSLVTGQLKWYSDALKTILVYTGGIGENTYTPSS